MCRRPSPTLLEIVDVVSDYSDKLWQGTTRARDNVAGLQSFYEAAHKDRQDLIDSYNRVIDILYQSYLEPFISLHSLNTCQGILVKSGEEEDYKKRLCDIGRQLHPKPLPPSRRSSTVEFRTLTPSPVESR